MGAAQRPHSPYHRTPGVLLRVPAVRAFRACRSSRTRYAVGAQGVHDERFEITSEGVFRFEGTGSYRDQRDHVGRYSVDLKVCSLASRDAPAMMPSDDESDAPVPACAPWLAAPSFPRLHVLQTLT